MIRTTIQHTLIMEAVHTLGDHPTVEQVYLEVLKRHPSISKATVYRNLQQLAQEGKICAVELPTSPSRYDVRTSAHYHFQCRVCGVILDFEPALEEALRSIKTPPGVHIETHTVSFGGLCPRCNTQRLL